MNEQRLLSLIIVFICLLFTVKSQSQDDYELIKNLTVENGLPSNNVYSIIQDKKGFIWMATDKGVVKYDGTNFKIFTTADGLPKNDIFDLREDSQGRIWLMSISNFIVYIQDDQVIRIKSDRNDFYFKEFTEDSIGISINKHSILEVIIDDSLQVYDADLHSSKRNLLFFKIVNVDSFTVKLLDEKKNLHQVGVYFANHQRTLSSNFFQVQNRYLSFYDQINSDLWIIDLVDGNKTIFPIPLGKNRETSIFKIRAYKDEFQLVVGNNLFLVDVDSLKLERKNLNIKKYCREPTSYVEVDDLIFVTSLDNGVMIFRDKKKSGLVNYIKSNVTCLVSVSDLLCAIGDLNGNIEILDDQLEKLAVFSHDEFNFDIRIKSLKYEDEKLYFSSNALGFGYIDISDLNSDLTFHSKQDTLYRFVQIRKINDEQTIGFGSNSAMLLDYSEGVENSTLLSKTLTYEFVVKDEKIYLGQDGGLEIYDRSNASSKSLKLDFNVRSLAFNHDHLLLGSEGKGLYEFDSNLQQVNHYLGDVSVYEIQINNSAIQLTTSNGIFFLDADSLSRIHDYYSTVDGLWSNDISTSFTRGSKIHLASTRGVQIIDTSIHQHHSQPLLYFQHETLNYTDTIILDEVREFNFSIGKIDYNEYPLDYYVSFSRKETDFRLSNNSTFNYRDIKPGSYLLKIYGKNDHYNYTTNLIEKSILVPPKIYETNLFRFFVALLTIGLFISIIYYRLKLNRKASDLKIQIEKEYALIELQSLQSQLNPHFVFNCLNSIQALITDNQTNLANSYLTKFSKLMRKFLHQSSSHITTLNEEIEVNRLYLELEKLRFKDKLNYKITIDPTVKDLEHEIPSVIIQPIVENAIRHGIFHKGSPGMVEIQVRQIDQFLEISISDDGIGLKASKELTADKNHDSIALSLLNRKKELLNIIEKVELQMEIHELDPGTKVIIKIPIQD